MKESDKTKNLGSVVIPKARGVPKSLFHVSTLKETEGISVSLPCIRRAVHYRFSHIRLPSPVPRGCRKGLEDKTYPAMDLLVHGELDGASCILVEDCIRML